ncbi:uncharacterized protein SPPG_03044 [Spizellomyces punctatus DAOM BR117]|uniref:RINT-1 family protein n=1 Tax=Spizellomyces punctatus (strain DAOM BR117) TaxID=645134 RepID=A0A0L0HNE0_SPIPD|nr:uncharacterized protein SPPG_03044 [Spizellomyces punctatus DAOM BR117]KND02587.1 hypothetical protein SPPG_03044 [Spizellomyces punctatus DAOM BR117]|eukprot:XP_016610626.1 hypothetical protein SPPG_03044 [Spizellomyces punctatus DAOM BR117]
MLPEEQVILLLNTQYSTLASLSNVAQHLKDKQEERILLEEQALQNSEAAPRKIRTIISQAKQTQDELEKLRERRLRLVETLDRVPKNDTVISYLISVQTKLQRLKMAKQYIDLLIKVEDLSTRIEQEMDRNMKESLAAYQELWSLWADLRDKDNGGPAVSSSQVAGMTFKIDMTTNLTDYIRQVTDGLHSRLRMKLARKLEQALDTLGWPNAVKIPLGGNEGLAAFREAFGELILLRSPHTAGDNDVYFLPPIEVMLQAPVLHFKYHFEGSRPTNRLDKPEWAFTRVLTSIRDHSAFLCGPVQELLEEYGFKSHDAKNLFIEGMVAAVTHKLRVDAPKLLREPLLLSHTIKETLAFDNALREIHLYGDSGTGWKGCVSVFTEQPQWFQEWLSMELAAAKGRFQDAIDADEAWEWADPNVSDLDEIKPTQSAETFISILEAVTDRYKLLPEFLHRLAFFNEIQLPLLEDYLQEIRTAIKRQVNVFHPINTPGAMLPSKTGRMQIICRYASSLHYVATVLREWTDQPFFVEFWEQLRKRTEETGDEQATLFDEVISAYESRVKRIEDIVVQDIIQEFGESMWQYDRRRNWALGPSSLNDDDHIEEISAEFCASLQVLSHFLPTIFENLPSTIGQLILRELASHIDEHLFTRIILRSRFNRLGARQLQVDIVQGLWNGVFRPWHRKPEVLFRRTSEALKLLNLPVNPAGKSDGKSLTLLGLLDVLLENDPKSVRSALEGIGVYRLSLEEVQDVLNRTVEVENIANQL